MSTTHEIQVVAQGDGTGVLVSTISDRIAKLTIVLPCDCHPSIEQAANVLQGYIKRIYGASVRIDDDTVDTAGAVIYIGLCRQTPADVLPAKNLGPEACAMVVRDGNIFLCAHIPFAAQYAVYAFLEESMGVRWFMPGPLGEYVPSAREAGLTVTVTDKVVAPQRSPRVLAGEGLDMFADWNLWRERNCFTTTQNVPNSVTDRLPWMVAYNGMYRIFTAQRYRKSHPQYFPLIDGRRWIPPINDDTLAICCWLPCLTNPEVVRATVDYLRDWFDQHPQVQGYPMGMDDVSRVCQCESCMATDSDRSLYDFEDELAYKKQRWCDRFFTFVNSVARELAKTHPDKSLLALINYYWQPPRMVDRIENNVYCYMPWIEAEWPRPEQREEETSRARQWHESGKCAHLNRYVYWGHNWIVPRYSPKLTAEALRLDVELGFEGIYIAAQLFWPHIAPAMWTGAKLLWDASHNVDALLNEYFTKMYGPAAPHIAAYYAVFETSWRNSYTPVNEPTGDHFGGFLEQGLAVSDETYIAGSDLLNKAAAAADSPLVAQRIDLLTASLQYCQHITAAVRHVEALGPLDLPFGIVDRWLLHEPEPAALTLKDQSAARALVERATNADIQIATSQAACRLIFDRPDLVGQSLQSMARILEFCPDGLNKRWDRLRLQAAKALNRALNWYVEHNVDAMTTLQPLIDRAPTDGFCRTCFEQVKASF